MLHIPVHARRDQFLRRRELERKRFPELGKALPPRQRRSNGERVQRQGRPAPGKHLRGEVCGVGADVGRRRGGIVERDHGMAQSNRCNPRFVGLYKERRGGEGHRIVGPRILLGGCGFGTLASVWIGVWRCDADEGVIERKKSQDA